MDNSRGINLLIAGATGSFVVALLHVIIAFVGGDWYRFFGAGEEMAVADEQGQWWPMFITLGLAFIFFVWGLYALSGAGRFQRLPLLRLGLLAITTIYLLRGLGIFAPLFGYTGESPSFMVLSSLIPLGLGICYLIGTRQRWGVLSRG